MLSEHVLIDRATARLPDARRKPERFEADSPIKDQILKSRLSRSKSNRLLGLHPHVFNASELANSGTRLLPRFWVRNLKLFVCGVQMAHRINAWRSLGVIQLDRKPICIAGSLRTDDDGDRI